MARQTKIEGQKRGSLNYPARLENKSPKTLSCGKRNLQSNFEIHLLHAKVYKPTTVKL